MTEAIDFRVKSLLADQPSQAFEVLFEQYFSICAKTAFYITKSQSLSEDLSQEVFLNLWNRKEQILSIDNIQGYILRSVKNLALNHLEKDKNRSVREVDFISLKSDHEESRDPEQARAIIEDMVNDLAPRTRLVFSMSRFEGMTNDEISDYLDISKRTVETQISLAIRSLKETARKHPKLLASAVATILLFLLGYSFI